MASFFEHDLRRQSRRQRLQPLFQRYQQTIGQNNKNMGFNSGFELVINGPDREIVLQFLAPSLPQFLAVQREVERFG